MNYKNINKNLLNEQIFQRGTRMKISIILILLLLCVNSVWTQNLSKNNDSQISIEENINFIGQWNTSNRCKSSYISDNTAYIINNNKLEILNISDPTSPNLIGQSTLNSSFLSEDVFGKDDHVYIANYKTIYMFDVSDPSNPDTVTSFEVESIINDISIVGDLLYLIASYDFYILDISDPSTITQLGKLTLPDESLGLTRFHVQGDYAYIGSWSDGLYIVDIADSEHPSMHGRFIEETSYIVFAQGSYAYVANDRYLYILDITDKVIPHIVIAEPSVGKTHDIFVDDKNIYTATDGGLVIYNKEDLSFVASHPIADISVRVLIEDGLTYLSSNSEGLNILQYVDPSAVEDSEYNMLTFKLNQNYPNPFNPTTTIQFELSETSFVNLSVYNSLGEMVAELENREFKPGYYQTRFDASNLPSGRKGLSSGIYYYKLKANDFVQARKMIYLK